MGFLKGVIMEKTIGDLVKNFATSYILPRHNSIGEKENKILYPVNATPSRKTSSGTKELSPLKCRQTVEQCPMLMKGMRKKAMDSVRAWHHLEVLDGDGTPIRYDLQLIESFEQRSNLKFKWTKARIDSYVYGDGYLLVTFQKDDATETWDAPSKEAYPWTVSNLNSECITEMDYYPKKKEYYRKRGIKHFHYENRETGENFWIHPDRMIHIVCDGLSYSSFGTSKVNLLRNIIKSKINVDIACGEILAWFAHGVYDIGIENCGQNDITRWTDIAKQHPGVWIHDKERESIGTVSPEAIDPKPFYDYLVQNIAAALIMPIHVLLGIQMGRVTGAEVGTGDYYKDVKDDQDLLYTPLLSTLYEWILKGHNYPASELEPTRRWKYKIVWNPIYIDELSEAEILRKRAESAHKLFTANIIDVKEARQMINKGQITLDTEIEPRPLKRPIPSEPPRSDKDAEKENLYLQQLTEAEKAMIKKRKEIVEAERKLGEKILSEQDKNVQG
jgi:hypothetical protein